MYLSETSFCTIYKAMVRSQLEYLVSVWNPYIKEDILRIEKGQMRAMKIVSSVKLLPYKNRLERLKLPTLKFQRIRGDLIELYKVSILLILLINKVSNIMIRILLKLLILLLIQ